MSHRSCTLEQISSMERHCSLDLWSPSPFRASGSGDSRIQSVAGNSQQLTIFYDGRVSVCNVTENQARAILYLAKQEMEASSKKDRRDVSSENELRMEALPSYHQQPQQQFRPAGLSMKRSLQQFLQKRKSRIQANFPYNQ